jgi:hypothetical protein
MGQSLGFSPANNIKISFLLVNFPNLVENCYINDLITSKELLITGQKTKGVS